MSQLQLSLLGTPVVKHGAHMLTFSTRKAQALLVYLAVEGGMHSRKTLSEAFWPELDAEHGRAALRATLLELRKLFERAHTVDESAHLLVERDTLSIAQDSSLLLDLRLVEALSKRVARSPEPPSGQARAELVAQLEQATCLVRGPFLAGFSLRDSQFFDDWTRQHREYLHLRIHQLFDVLSLLYERAGETERAIDAVGRWLSFDALNEEGCRRLMRLRFSQGDRTGALRAYAHGRAVLAEQLQVEPEPETVALARQIRHAAPVRASQPRPLHASPEHLLDGPFLGRTGEFGTLIECYQRTHVGYPQLVLLQGETGIGKTRLSSEFAGWAQAQGATVLTGRAFQTGRQLPYQPLIAALRCQMQQEHAPGDLLSAAWQAELSRLLPELRAQSSDLPVPSANEALGDTCLFEAIVRLIHLWAARRPLVLLLDDMQWADTATLDLLLYLAWRLAEQPAPVLLLLNLSTETAVPAWLMALKRTHLPLTTLAPAAFTEEETLRFVQALAWAEQPLEVGNDTSTNGHTENRESSPLHDALIPFANWLYFQTQGQPLYLVEMLKGLFAREIICPSLQEHGAWGLVLRTELLAQTPVNDLIPESIRELLRSQRALLTPSARTLLTAATALGQRLTFERLVQVAQLDEQEGLRALEELLQQGWLREEAQACDGYTFPREMTRELVAQESGVTRQRLMRRRVSLVMREEVEDTRAFLRRVEAKEDRQKRAVIVGSFQALSGHRLE